MFRYEYTGHFILFYFIGNCKKLFLNIDDDSMFYDDMFYDDMFYDDIMFYDSMFYDSMFYGSMFYDINTTSANYSSSDT